MALTEVLTLHLVKLLISLCLCWGMAAHMGYQAVASSSAANLKAAAARIQDTDYALETANLTKAAILNQSAMAMVAQANQAQQAILTVIQ